MLLRVEDLVVEFPVGRSGKVNAVVGHQPRRPRGRDARPRRRVGVRQVDDRARAVMQLPRPTSGTRALRRRRAHRLKGDALPQTRPQHADDLPGPDLVAQPAPQGRRHRRRGARDLGDRRRRRRARPRSTRCSRPVGLDPDTARGPPTARVLRWPVPAHLDRPRRHHRPEAHHLRRAGVGARRVGAGADPQPPRGDEAALRPHACSSSRTTSRW